MLILILISFVSFLPIIVWAYIFSYIDDNLINKKRFIVGVLAGIFSVIPILYIDKISLFFSFKYINIFYFVSQIKDFFSGIEFSFSLYIFFFMLIIFSFISYFFVKKSLETFKVYMKNIVVFIFFIFFISIFVYLVNHFSYLDFKIDNSVYFGNIVFSTFKLVIFYYLLVAFIEEASKHFNFLQSSFLYIDSVKTGVLYSIFVALGFSFLENILYIYNFWSQYSFSFELLKIYFFRSIFSVMIHVLCSSIIAYYFSRALILYRGKELNFPYLKIFLMGLFVSILLHMFFDIALTLGFYFVIIIYFVLGYLYVSSIFYRE